MKKTIWILNYYFYYYYYYYYFIIIIINTAIKVTVSQRNAAGHCTGKVDE